MTPKELAALPVGTRVKLNLVPFWRDRVDDQVYDWGYDYGVINKSGVEPHIRWEEGSPSESIIYTQSDAFFALISDISIA
jgi:hypothetical protein